MWKLSMWLCGLHVSSSFFASFLSFAVICQLMAAVPCSNDNSTNYSRRFCLSWLCLWSMFAEWSFCSFDKKYQRNSDQETLTSSELFQFAIREQMFGDERGEREEKIGTNSRTPNAEATRMPFRPPSIWADPPNEIRQPKMLGQNVVWCLHQSARRSSFRPCTFYSEFGWFCIETPSEQCTAGQMAESR